MVKRPKKSPQPEEPDLSLNGFKRGHVQRVLEACDGDVERAARLLGVQPAEVLRWLQAADEAR